MNIIESQIKPIYSWLLHKKRFTTNQLFGDKNYGRYILISRSRTGSTWLMTLLRYHENLECEGEIFKHLNGKPCFQIWNNFLRKRPKAIKEAGFKLFYNHPYEDDQTIWDIIENDKSIKIIHLVRENYLRSHLSEKIGEKTKKWTESIYKPDNLNTDDKKVNLNFETCLEVFERTFNQEARTREKFKDHDFIEVSYEQLLDNEKKHLYKIFEFLGVSNLEIKVANKRQNPEKISNLISNYPEIHEKLSATRWSTFLDEY